MGEGQQEKESVWNLSLWAGRQKREWLVIPGVTIRYDTVYYRTVLACQQSKKEAFQGARWDASCTAGLWLSGALELQV